MIQYPAASAANNPLLVMIASSDTHLPRVWGGTNSASVPAATTSSAPSPIPMMNRSTINHSMSGAKHAAIDASPNTARLS